MEAENLESKQCHQREIVVLTRKPPAFVSLFHEVTSPLADVAQGAEFLRSCGNEIQVCRQ